MSLAAVRVRGTVNVTKKIQDTMQMLNLKHPNHCVVVPDDPATEGMMKKAKDYITYGEVDAGTLTELLAERARLTADEPLTEEYLAEHTEHSSFQDFAEAVVRGDASLKDLPDLKPTFRLQPPRKGFRSKKRHHSIGGSLGYRGREINDLIRRMI